MAIDEKKQPIVVKRVKKGGAGHHGGAWKVAYADFVTAMMAFFLLMWLLGSTGAEDRQSIADVFKNPSAVQGPGGASTSMIKLGGAMEVPRGEGEPMRKPTPGEMAQDMQEAAKLDDLMQEIKKQIENTPALIEFKEQMLLDVTSEGLRIQIIDKKNRPMFALGSAVLKDYTVEILHELARTIDMVPNHISISGHTDATPFSSGARPGYTNWELSADRANAARRALIEGGLSSNKFGRVVGLASSVLLDKADPTAPVNRRISIVVLNKATEKAIGLNDSKEGGRVAPVPEPAPAPPVVPVAPQSDAAPLQPIKLPAPVLTQETSSLPAGGKTEEEASPQGDTNNQQDDIEDALSRALAAPQ
jgi:chemotaxis protein MotB